MPLGSGRALVRRGARGRVRPRDAGAPARRGSGPWRGHTWPPGQGKSSGPRLFPPSRSRYHPSRLSVAPGSSASGGHPMSDQRSVMKEYRHLDEKRLAEGLTPDEEARFARLRDLMAPELGAGRVRAGFDVNAAAAQLRDSLLPAGLRNRPPPTPEPSPEPEPEPAAPELSAADALASV